MSENPPFSDPSTPIDLGFSYHQRQNGEIEIRHHGRLAATLRGTKAHRFLAEVEAETFAAGQQLMARITGNYKRGNERAARNHPRNKG